MTHSSPRTASQVEELLESFGAVVGYWMPNIKTHCWVVYENAESAVRAAEGMEGLKFPEHRIDGKVLKAKVVDVEDAKKVVESKSEDALRGGMEGSAGKSAGPERGERGEELAAQKRILGAPSIHHWHPCPSHTQV